MFVLFHFGFGTMCTTSDVQNWAWQPYFVCSLRRTGRRGLSRCQDFNVQKRNVMQTATLGLSISSFTHFFVWHINALTQFILNNMNSINMCSQILTNTLKEQLCTFAKWRFHKHVHHKGNTPQTLNIYSYGNVYANSNNLVINPLSQD